MVNLARYTVELMLSFQEHGTAETTVIPSRVSENAARTRLVNAASRCGYRIRTHKTSRNGRTVLVGTVIPEDPETPGSRGTAPLHPKKGPAIMTASTTTPDRYEIDSRVQTPQGLGTVLEANHATADTHERVRLDWSKVVLRFPRADLTPAGSLLRDNNQGGVIDFGALLFMIVLIVSVGLGTLAITQRRDAEPPPCVLVYHGVNNGTEAQNADWNWFVETVSDVNYEPTGDRYGTWTFTETPDSPVDTYLGASAQEDSDIWSSPACIPDKDLVGS